MRTLGLILMLATAEVAAQAPQPMLCDVMPMQDGVVYYEAVMQVDSVPADEIYRMLKSYVFDSFKSGKDVVQLDDPVNRELRTRGALIAYWQNTFSASFEVRLYHKLTIAVRDGRFKYTLTNVEVEHDIAGNSDEGPIETWNTFRPQNRAKAIANFNEEIESFITGLARAAATPRSIDGDW